MLQLLSHHKSALANNSRALDAVSPLATLSRGYSVIKKSGSVVTDAAQLQPGDQVDAMLAKGQITATITSKTINQ